MAIETKVRRELSHLTQADIAAAQQQDAYPDISGKPVFIELFRYQVPVDRKLTFEQGHIFSLYAKKLAEGVAGAVADDGGAQTNETAEANNATANDMTLLPATPAVGDAYYFSYEFPFNKLRINIGTNGAGVWTLAWEYYNGLAWVALPGLSDGTTGFMAGTGNKDVTFTIPSNWAKTEVLGFTEYWIRARVSAYTSVTTQPKGTQAWIHSATEMDNTDRIRLEVREANELAKKILIDQAMYAQVKEFTERSKLYRLDIVEPVGAKSNMWLVILVLAKAPIDVSECYFDLTCNRERFAII